MNTDAIRLGALLVAMTSAFAVSAVEEADYSVHLEEDGFEIRDYAPQVVAEVIVEDEFTDAGNRAFRPLFRYISGDNTAQSKIDMTAPVTQAARGEKIAMTAPVGQRATQAGWAVSFMMPAEFTLETLPRPTNDAVSLRAIPARRMAAVRYTGRWTSANYERHLAELQAWVQARGLEMTGEPVWARYNGPFTPWFMRRNEILIPVGDDALESGARPMP